MSRSSRAPTPAQTIVIPNSIPMVSLLGAGDELLRIVESSFDAQIYVRGNEITISGAAPGEAELVDQLFGELVAVVRSGQGLTPDAVERSIAMVRSRTGERPADVLTFNILSNRGRTIRAKTLGQKRYVDAIDNHTVVFSVGPAGTGKTYLAMAKAVQALQSKQVNRIILTRPAVEAGERLGYLPGTLSEKIDPYLRPLYDALHDMIDPDSIPRLLTAGTIEVAPLAYMRGRAQPLRTRVLTPGGWRPIGELRVGDLVLGSNGEPTPVLGVYPQGVKEIYRVQTQDGAATLACADHLWAVATRDDRRRGRPLRVVETRDLIGNLRAAHYHRYELPLLSRPAQFEPREVPMDPYALGLLLGDGCMTGRTTPSFATADHELVAALGETLSGVTIRGKGNVDHVLSRTRRAGEVVTLENPVTAALRALELWGTRSDTTFVPYEYLYNAPEVRLAVLQGLLDSDDGPVAQQGRTCRIQYTTTSPRMRDGVLFLVRSLGGVAYWRRREAAGRSPGHARGRQVHHRQDAYVLDIRLPATVPPFRLARKLERYTASGAGGRPMRFIDRIDPAGAEEAVCIQVGAADSLYVTEDFLLTHNTLNDAFVILDEAQNTTPEQIKMFLTRLGFGSRMVVNGDITQIDLPGAESSGLTGVQQILAGIEDVKFCELTSHDVVRHKLVAQIVAAYDRYESRHPRSSGPAGPAGSADGRRRR